MQMKKFIFITAIDKLQSTLYNRVNVIHQYYYFTREENYMKSEEALEQIAYIKDLLVKSRLKATEGYPAFLLVGTFWFLGNIMSVLASYFPWINYLWIVFGFACIVIMLKVVRQYKWPAMNTKLLKQMGTQCLVILISSIPVGVLLFYLHAVWAFKAYIPFQVGVVYIVIGVFIGRDLKGIGFGLIATSLLSLLIPYPLQDIWLAVVGGGGLILTGMIFRNQVKKSG
jgi:hypothetical protein